MSDLQIRHRPAVEARTIALSPCAHSDAQSLAEGHHRLALRWLSSKPAPDPLWPHCGRAVGASSGLELGRLPQLSVWELPAIARVTLVREAAGPSPYPTLVHGWGRASKRQSQTKKRPKLEFRGPLNSPVFRPFSTKSVLNSAWRPKLNKLGACDVEGLSRHCRHGRRELGGAAGGAHVLSTPVPELRI